MLCEHGYELDLDPCAICSNFVLSEITNEVWEDEDEDAIEFWKQFDQEYNYEAIVASEMELFPEEKEELDD